MLITVRLSLLQWLSNFASISFLCFCHSWAKDLQWAGMESCTGLLYNFSRDMLSFCICVFQYWRRTEQGLSSLSEQSLQEVALSSTWLQIQPCHYFAGNEENPIAVKVLKCFGRKLWSTIRSYNIWNSSVTKILSHCLDNMEICCVMAHGTGQSMKQSTMISQPPRQSLTNILISSRKLIIHFQVLSPAL